MSTADQKAPAPINPAIQPEPADVETVGARVACDTGDGFTLGTVVAVGPDRICGRVPLQVRWDDGEESEEYGPEKATTLRRRLLRDRPRFYSHRIASVYQDRHTTRARAASPDFDGEGFDSESSAYRWDIREWSLAVDDSALANPDALCILPDHSTESHYDEDLVGKANAEAWSERTCWGVLGSHVGGSLALWLDVEAPESIVADAVEALEALESYPLLDDEVHSRLEMEASEEDWNAWGRDEALEALAEALALSKEDGWMIESHDTETPSVLAPFDGALHRAATENETRVSSNASETVRRWIVEQSPPEYRSERPWTDYANADRVRLAKPYAVAELIRIGALRLCETSPEETVLEHVGAFGPCVNPEHAREALRSCPGIIDPDPDRAGEVSEPDGFRTVLQALDILGRKANSTGPLPFPE